MVSLALPTGSLEKPTLALFADAGLAVQRSAARSCRARIDFPDLDAVAFHKPREIPGLVADGVFDIGLTGSDWIEENGAKVECVHGFDYAKKTSAGWRIVLAVPTAHRAAQVADLPRGTRVASEYPALTRTFLAEHDLVDRVSVVHSHGSTEGKIPEVADAVVEVVETGTSLLHNDLRVLAVVRRCGPTVVASPQRWAEPAARAAVERIVTLLRAAECGARHVLLTVVVPDERLADLRLLLPGRWWRLPGGGHAVLQAPVLRSGIAETVTALVGAGALEIVETPIGKLVSP